MLRFYIRGKIMPYKNKTPLAKVESTNIIGAYFRNQRISDGISLVFVADSIPMNKGYLSDLENGKRPFSQGLINQLNEFYDTSFVKSEEYYNDLQNLLYDAFNNLFNINETKEKEILNSIVNHKQEYEHSNAFFIYQIIKLFYYIRVEMNEDEFNISKKMLEENLDAIEKKDIAIFYCLLAIFYKRKTSTNNIAESYLNKAISIVSNQSKIYAVCIFEMITIYSKTNRVALAYGYCEQAKFLFSYFNNYTVLFFIDLYQYNCMSLLGLYENAKNNLIKLLNNITPVNEKYISMIYHNLAWNSLLEGDYEYCIQMSNKAIEQGNKSDDLFYFIPYSYYKLNQPQIALHSIKDNVNSISNLYKPLLIAIEAKIKNNNKQFENSIFTFYKTLLVENEYEDIIVPLEIMIDYFKETDQKDKLIITYVDYKKYTENKLNISSSQILKTQKISRT